MSPTRYFSVSWDTLHRDCRALVWRLLEIQQNQGENWKGIVAVTRGGLVPAAIVAREIEIRLIETLCIKSYHGNKTQGNVEVLKGFDGDGEGWLIIDDLVDTGTTGRKIRELLPKAHFATIYAKPAGRDLVDTFITEVSQDTWILFPWDLELQDATPMIERWQKK